MICQVAINDYKIGCRMVYVLEDYDFNIQRHVWNNTDELLMALQGNALFAGRTHWVDLELQHFHVMIVNILRLMSGLTDADRGNRSHGLVKRLTFLLCGFICVLQDQSESTVELLRVNRVSDTDVLYDFNATLEVNVTTPIPKLGLKLVVDKGPWT